MRVSIDRVEPLPVQFFVTLEMNVDELQALAWLSARDVRIPDLLTADEAQSLNVTRRAVVKVLTAIHREVYKTAAIERGASL